jgi:hypothetical protein
MINIKILNKFTIVAFMAVSFSGIVNSGTGTQTWGPASAYNVELKKVELCTSSACTTAHTLVEKTQVMDIASVDVGAAVGSYASTMTLPPIGVSYTHMRSTVDRTFTITGYAASTGAGYCYTKSGTPTTPGTYTKFETGSYVAGAADATNAGSATLVSPNADTLSLNGVGGTVGWDYNTPSYAVSLGVTDDAEDMTVVNLLTTPYTYYGQTPIIDIAFSTQLAVINMESFGGEVCNLTPGEPELKITIK